MRIYQLYILHFVTSSLLLQELWIQWDGGTTEKSNWVRSSHSGPSFLYSLSGFHYHQHFYYRLIENEAERNVLQHLVTRKDFGCAIATSLGVWVASLTERISAIEQIRSSSPRLPMQDDFLDYLFSKNFFSTLVNQIDANFSWPTFYFLHITYSLEALGYSLPHLVFTHLRYPQTISRSSLFEVMSLIYIF